jgi:hypothetical protein
MQTQDPNIAHSLYVLYESLSDETQRLFLQELLAKQKEKVESSLKITEQLSQRQPGVKADEKNRFAELCGILTSDKSVSLEDMERAIYRRAAERFNDCVQ